MKIIRHNPSGAHFCECPRGHWHHFLDLWDNDNTKACPLPQGHPIFAMPLTYNCEEVADVNINGLLAGMTTGDFGGERNVTR